MSESSRSTEIAGRLRNVSMAATAYDLLRGTVDKATVVARLRRDSYGTTDARWELADEIERAEAKP